MTAKAYLLKIRGGVEVDSKGQKAGKGPLIAEEISNTLGTSQDQYLFQPVDKFVLDDQGGSVIRWRWDGKSPCLRVQMGGHSPVVIRPVAFDGYNQTVTGDVTTTLRAGMSNCSSDTVPCVVLESHPNDSRVKIDDSGSIQTLTSCMGTGGGNVPMVMMPYSKSRRAKSAEDFETWKESRVSNTINTFDQGDVRATDVVVMATQRPNAEIMVDKCPTITASAGLGGTWKPVVVYGIDQQGGKGTANYTENIMPTLCSDSHGTPHAVAYGISSYESNAMKSSNPRAGIHETNTARTIDVNGGNPACNQGGVVVVEQMYWDGSQIAGTLTTSNASGAQRMPDKEQFNCVIERVVYPETTGALMASGYNKLGTQEAMNDMFVVCEKGVTKTISMEVFHCDSAEERTAALKAGDYKDPQIIALDRAALNQGKNAKYDISVDGGGTAQTLIARGPGAVCYRKPVRK